MKSNNTLLAALQQINKTESPYSIVATVSAVDLASNTCDCVPVLELPDLLDVSLMPLDADGNVVKGFLLVPKVGSIVVVALTSPDTGYLAVCTEVEEIQLNGTTYAGLVKIEPLITKLNNLENKVNTHLTAYNAHTHSVVTSCGAGAGTGTAAVTTSTVSGTLTPTQQTDLENTTVKHGNGE